MSARQPFSSSPYTGVGYWSSLSPDTDLPRRTSVFARILYGFSWAVVSAAGCAGALLVLQRNDVLLDVARKYGIEQRYVQLEKAVLGAPGWGTPRSVDSSVSDVSQTSSAASLVNSGPAQRAADDGASDAAAPMAAPVSSALPPTPAPDATEEGVAIVSLDALPVQKQGAARDVPAATAVPASPPQRAPASTPRPGSTPRSSSPPAKTAPVPRAAQAPAPKPAKPPPVAPAPADDNPLKAAIRAAVMKDKAGGP